MEQNVRYHVQRLLFIKKQYLTRAYGDMTEQSIFNRIQKRQRYLKDN